MHHANAIVTLSLSDKKYIESLGISHNKIFVIPNAINFNKWNDIKVKCDEIEIIKNKYNLKNKYIILYVGQLIKRKGISYLIQSITLLPEYIYKNIVIIIIGDGGYSFELIELAKKLGVSDKILFMGTVSERELFIYYKISNLFILPSLSEGLPTTILEAMYFGLPVISTNISGIKDYFYKYAILIPPRNKKALANAMISIILNTNLAENLKKLGMNYVISTFSWDKIIHDYNYLFSKISDEK